MLLVDDDDNAPDVRAAYEVALSSLGLSWDVFDTGNSDTEPTALELAAYPMVIWFSGHEVGGFAGPGALGESALSSWLGSGRCLLMSSQDYLFDRGLTAFGFTVLGIDSFLNNQIQTDVVGAGTPFAGLGARTLAYPFANASDSLSPAPGAEVVFFGNNGAAALSNATGTFATIFLAFPFEALPLPADRLEVLGRAFDFCAGTTIFGDGVETGDSDRWSTTVAMRFGRSGGGEGIIAALVRRIFPSSASPATVGAQARPAVAAPPMGGQAVSAGGGKSSHSPPRKPGP